MGEKEFGYEFVGLVVAYVVVAIIISPLLVGLWWEHRKSSKKK